MQFFSLFVILQHWQNLIWPGTELFCCSVNESFSNAFYTAHFCHTHSQDWSIMLERFTCCFEQYLVVQNVGAKRLHAYCTPLVGKDRNEMKSVHRVREWGREGGRKERKATWIKVYLHTNGSKSRDEDHASPIDGLRLVPVFSATAKAADAATVNRKGNENADAHGKWYGGPIINSLE